MLPSIDGKTHRNIRFMVRGTFKIHMKYINKNATSRLNTCNMCLKHLQHRNIKIYFCNIRREHLQHSSEASETHGTYACNMHKPVGHHGRRPELLQRPAWGKPRGAADRGRPRPPRARPRCRRAPPPHAERGCRGKRMASWWSLHHRELTGREGFACGGAHRLGLVRGEL